MFERVLYATDFSEYAQKITECIGEIPGIKEIIILHVIHTKRTAYGDESESVLIKKAELILQEQKNRLESLGKTIKTKVKIGIPSREILRVANEENVSLVVMGARGLSLIKDILLGSVSSDVLRYGKTNRLLLRYKVAIILVHVVDKGETKEELNACVREAERKLKDIQSHLEIAGLNVDYHVRIGNPTDEINRVAEEDDVSLIAIGTRGKGLIKEIRIGSTAENVVRNAKRPVLVIKQV